MKNKFLLIIYLFLILITNNQYAKETLIYADFIDYNSDKDLVAKGNVKIMSQNEVITSDLVIINEKEDRITLPIDFQYKDNQNHPISSGPRPAILRPRLFAAG